jgi:hypothetical protein
MKPTDKAILGMVSESSGRKESEPRSGLVKICFRKSRSLVRNEDCMAAGRLADAACHFGGVVGTARWQGRAEQLVKPSSSHREIGGALERAKEVTRYERWTAVEYARFADDLVILVDSQPRRRWLRQAVEKRLREELAKLQVPVNEEKSRKVELQRGEGIGFLGFAFRRIRSHRGRWMPLLVPKGMKRTALLGKLKQIFRVSRSQPCERGDREDQSDSERLGEILRDR